MNPTRSRIAGAVGIAFVLTAFVGSAGPFFDDPSRSEILAWVHAHPHAIGLAGLQVALTPVLIGVVVMALVGRSGHRGVLAVLALVCMLADAAVDQVSAAVSWSLAELGQQQGAGDAVVAMFSLSKQLTFADGFLFGIAALCACTVSLRSRSLPAPLIWLGFLVGAVRVLGTPLDVVVTGDPHGPDGPVGMILLLLWILACSVLLLLRPGSAGTVGGTTDRAAEGRDLQVSGTNR